MTMRITKTTFKIPLKDCVISLSMSYILLSKVNLLSCFTILMSLIALK